MRRTSKLRILVLVLVSIGLAGFTLVAQESRLPRNEVRVVSGQDIGFRVEGRDLRTGNPTGTWVVRIDGNWVPVGTSPTVIPAR